MTDVEKTLAALDFDLPVDSPPKRIPHVEIRLSLEDPRPRVVGNCRGEDEVDRLERGLGRTLAAHDFTGAPVNGGSARLRERIFGRRST
jgi:hypothetical protein